MKNRLINSCDNDDAKSAVRRACDSVQQRLSTENNSLHELVQKNAPHESTVKRQASEAKELTKQIEALDDEIKNMHATRAMSAVLAKKIREDLIDVTNAAKASSSEVLEQLTTLVHDFSDDIGDINRRLAFQCRIIYIADSFQKANPSDKMMDILSDVASHLSILSATDEDFGITHREDGVSG